VAVPVRSACAARHATARSGKYRSAGGGLSIRSIRFAISITASAALTMVLLRNADLCSPVVLRLSRRKSKQPKRLTPKSRSVQLNAKKKRKHLSVAVGNPSTALPMGAGAAAPALWFPFHV
jgi:hypothetical protein